MSLTRAQWRTQVSNQADIAGSTRWDFTVGGEVDIRIGNALDRIWRSILDTNRFYRQSLKAPTSDSQGRFLLTDLQILTGDAQERLYKILQFVIDAYPYEDVCDDAERYFPLWTLASGNSGSSLTGRRVWWRGGIYIYTLPVQTAKLSDLVAVNHIPTKFDQLSGDSVVVDFPDGFEDVGFNEAAADLLMKGAAETEASQELRANGAARRSEMLESIARISTKPTRIRYSDDVANWGLDG